MSHQIDVTADRDVNQNTRVKDQQADQEFNVRESFGLINLPPTSVGTSEHARSTVSYLCQDFLDEA